MFRIQLFRAAALTAAMAFSLFSGCDTASFDNDAAWDASLENTPKAASCDDMCSPSCLCRAGEGDCDSDRDCAAGLFCPADGTGIERCQVRVTTSCAGKCSPSCPCRAGEGDCDTNADCAAGLSCPPNGDGTELCKAAGTTPPPNPTPPQGELKIVVLSVGSADSALIVFPTGATMLVDSATESRAKSRVIPFLKRHRISRLNYYAETHPHPDHVGGQAPLRANGFITTQTKVWTWETFKFADKFDLEGTKWFIYNARDKVFHSSANTPDDEDTTNANSLSFRMEYNGFVYSATGDEGRRSQQRFLNTYPALVRAHVRNTAHHLWGPVVPAFDKATDPFLFIVSSENSVKEERSWRDFMGVVRDLKNGQGRLRDYAFTPDTGHVFVRARSGTDWGYSYCKSVDTCVLW